MYKLYYLTSIIDCYQPRYIGYTSRINLDIRLDEHIRSSKFGKSYKNNWIYSLLKKDVKIEIFEIDSATTIDEILYKEVFYVENFRKWYSITNSTNGGEFNKTYIDSVKKKISNSLKKYYSENDNWAKGKTYKLSEESRIKRRIKLGDKISGVNNPFFNKKHSLETIKILSQKNRKYNYSYSLFYDMYIVKLLSNSEMSEFSNLPICFINKMIRKYKLAKIKKLIYGKIKGKISKIEDVEVLYKYYDNSFDLIIN